METTRDVGAVGTGMWNIRQTVPEGRRGDRLSVVFGRTGSQENLLRSCVPLEVASSARHSNRIAGSRFPRQLMRFSVLAHVVPRRG